jgi:hypothetical protein
MRLSRGASRRLFLPEITALGMMALGAAFCDDVSSAPSAVKNSGPLTTEEEVLDALNLDTPGLEKVKAAAAAGDMAAVKAAYLDYRRTTSPARWWLLSRDVPQETPPLVLPQDALPEAVAQDDPAADEILKHHLYGGLYGGHKVVDMGKDFDWTYNPISRSDSAFNTIWTFEVARTEFWQKLSEGYWRTRDEKYASGWVEQMESFVKKNPVNTSPIPSDTETVASLWRPLEAALRMAYTWPDAYFHFLHSPSFTPDHALLIRRALENRANKSSDVVGNHITTDCFALYTIGALFPEFREAGEWRQLSLDILTSEIQRLVPPDGFDAELSPGYQIVAIHGFVGVVEIAKLNHLPIPDLLKTKLLSMYQALVLVMDPSGNDVPNNDSWGVASAAKMAREGLLFLGDDPLLAWAASGGKKGTPPPTSTMLPYAGFYAMRGGWKPDDLFLFFRGGPSGIDHVHEDMLEVTLNAWGKTLLFDTGVYPYDLSDWRRFTLGTASHSTIIVDDKWQHRGNSAAPVTEPVYNPWVATPLFDYVAATYDRGYQKNEYQGGSKWNEWVGPVDHSVTHARRVLFLKPYYALVLDTLDGTGHHIFDAQFHIDATGATLDPTTQAAFSQSNDNVHLALYPLDRDNLATDIVQGQKDPLLGWFPIQHRAIPTIRFRKEQEAPATFATFLYPYQGQAPTFSAAPLNAGEAGLWAESLQTSSESAEIAVVKGSAPSKIAFHSDWAGDVQATAALLVLRKPAQGGSLCFGGRNISGYQDKDIAFSISTPASLAWIKSGGRLLFYNAENAPLEVKLTIPSAQILTLPPGVWTKVSARGTSPAGAPPEPFAPVAIIKPSF